MTSVTHSVTDRVALHRGDGAAVEELATVR